MIRVADPSIWKKIHKLVNTGMPYAYFIDDNFWLLLGKTPLDIYYQDFSVRRTLEAAVSGATVVLCHSERFKKFLQAYNVNVAVVPAYFDFSCLDGLPVVPENVGERRIGIVANASRSEDLAIIVPAIRAVADEAGDDVFFEFFGYIPPELLGHPKIRYFEPIDDYRTFIRAQYSRNWLLGLSPLRENAFSAYKSNNKFREFGGCSIAGIYSDVTVYRESVVDGETGWLVGNTPDAWRQKMLDVLKQPDFVRKVGANAHVEVKTRYNISAVRRSWLAALRPVLEHKPKRLSRLQQRFKALFQRDLSAVRNVFFAKAKGWELGLRPPFGDSGFHGAQVMFKLMPGDSISTELLPPLDGAFHWSFVIATFKASPRGRIVVEVMGEGAEPSTFELKDDEIRDNATYPLEVNLFDGHPVSVRLSNHTDSPLGIYALSPNGSTRFGSSGKSFVGRFIV